MADRLAVARRDYIAVRMTADAAHELAMQAAARLWDEAPLDPVEGQPGKFLVPRGFLVQYNDIGVTASADWSRAVADADAEVTTAIAEARADGIFHWDVARPGETIGWPECMFCHHPVPGGVEDYPGSGVICADADLCDERLMAVAHA